MDKLIIKSYLLLAPFIFVQHVFADDKTQLDSNLKNFSYPSHKCKSLPVRPKKPEKFSPQDEVEKYNNEISKYNINVSDYNKAIKQYKSCINQYIKNGNNDIHTIRQKLNAALKEARSR